ncbi:MFS transporter [Curvibacter sp. CHRR-16]|uniref:MFS transporter n=1 Tax=Curvibacter sp. CHRR-16 TaxID=2835872 RepID=UPI001BDB0168|nr:MFS transporter [Curvibacter sp. CHRR-16]MBT0570239.1 MFS transporter [Curvibacter sp. CHRR-16]
MRSESSLNAPPLAGVPPPKRLMGLLGFVQFAHLLDFMLMLPLAPLLMGAWGLQTRQYGVLLAAYGVAAAVSGVVATTYVHRFERKRLLLALLAVLALAQLVCASANSYAVLLVGRIAAGACAALVGALLQTLVGDLFAPQQRGRAVGVLLSGTSAATVLGVPLVLVLINYGDWRHAFAFTAGLSVLSIVLLQVAMPMVRVDKQRAGAAGYAVLVHLLRNGAYRRVLAFMGLGAFATFVVIPYMPLYLTSNLQWPTEQLALVYVLGGAMAFATAQLAGRMADRWNKVHLYRTVALVSMVPIVLQTHLPASAWWVVLAVSTLFFSFAPSRAVPAMAIAVSAVAPPDRGAFMALNAAVQQLACGVAAYVGAQLVHMQAGVGLQGYSTAGWVAIAVTLSTAWMAGRIPLPSSTKA